MTYKINEKGVFRHMEASTANIEEIVKQVLANMAGGGTAVSPAGSGGQSSEIPKTARVAMLTGLEPDSPVHR